MDVRNSARALLIDDDNHILLFKFRFQTIKDNINESINEFWITPGGGLDTGESFEQALQRELVEETGLIMKKEPKWVWTREVVFEKRNKPFLSHERYYLIYIKDCDVGEICLTDNERRNLLERRWWRIDEINKSDENFRPMNMDTELNVVLSNPSGVYPRIIP